MFSLKQTAISDAERALSIDACPEETRARLIRRIENSRDKLNKTGLSSTSRHECPLCMRNSFAQYIFSILLLIRASFMSSESTLFKL